MQAPSITWCNEPEQVPALVDFFVQNLSEAYISHFEIQSGRAMNNRQWAPSLKNLITEDFKKRTTAPRAPAQNLHRLCCATSGEKLVALATVDLTPAAPVPYATIGDILVAQTFRSQGIGSDMLGWIQSELESANYRRFFLESGINNSRAHDFFNKHGFKPCSMVLMKDV